MDATEARPEQREENDPMFSGLDLNDRSFERIIALLKKEKKDVSADKRQDLVRKFFVSLIQSAAGVLVSSSRHLTIETIRRYVFVLNTVEHDQHVSEV
jgi:hypothetical protein